MSDVLVFVIILASFGAGMYLIGHERGRQKGWHDAQEWAGQTSRDRATPDGVG